MSRADKTLKGGGRLLRLRCALALGACLIGPEVAQARTIDCGKPPPLTNETMKAELRGAAQTVGKVGQVQLSGALATSRSEVLSKYPNADRALADAYYRYEVCELVANDPKLSVDQKLARINASRGAFAKPAKITSKPAIPTRAPARPSAPRPPAPSNAISQTGNGNIGVQINGVRALTRREYVPMLQVFYNRGSIILQRARDPAISEEKFVLLMSDANAWIATTHDWITANMTAAAAAKFELWRPMPLSFRMDGEHPDSSQKAYENINILFPQMLDNLEYLTEHDGMDPMN